LWPVDYRALGNAGLWCVGRLQTDADRERVIERLSLSGGDRDSARAIGDVVKRLAPRWFLLRDAHASGGPVLLQPRWAMSFLRGPMTRRELEDALRAHRLAACGRGEAALHGYNDDAVKRLRGLASSETQERRGGR